LVSTGENFYFPHTLSFIKFQISRQGILTEGEGSHSSPSYTKRFRSGGLDIATFTFLHNKMR